MTKAEETLIGIKFISDMYSAGVDTAENTLEKVREILKPVVSLNDDQQVVLEWWVKKLNEEGEDADPLGVICAMQSYGLREEKIYDAAVNLTPAQQYQVLAAFAEWAQEQEED